MNERHDRFIAGHMHDVPKVNPRAPLRHVEAESRTKQRDRFGNRVFTSSELSYKDRKGRETKSALLVSEAGERFIKDNPGILKDIDRALQTFAYNREDVNYDVAKERLDLGGGRFIQYLGEGGQSFVYRLETPQKTYVVKIHRTYSRVHQPYINEMLQVQSLERNLHEQVKEAGVAFPQFMFASGQVACAEFVPNMAEFPPDFESTYYAAATVCDDYIKEQQRNGNELWNRVRLDKVHNEEIPTANFRRNNDGTHVWIDPVAYYSERPNGGNPTVYLSESEWRDLRPLPFEEMKKEYALAAKEMH